MPNFYILAIDGEEEKGLKIMLMSFPSTEIGKSGGRVAFYLGSAKVTSLDFCFFNYRHIRTHQMFFLEKSTWEPWTLKQ